METADPGALLRLGEGPRGFWARGNAWFAHVGAAATLRVEHGEVGDDRFQTVKRRALELSTDLARCAGDDAPYRFYGGFAFRGDQPGAEAWRDFPSASFVLPEIELAWSANAARLRVLHRIGDRETAEEAEARLDRTTRAVRSQLARARAEPADGGKEGFGDADSGPGVMDRPQWERLVRHALRRIDAGDVAKVVLARTRDVTTKDRADPVRVVMALLADNPRAHVFLFEPVRGAAFLGAAPETVATVYGDAFHATAVAGSISHGSTPEETAALAERLLASRKDQLEHRFAVEDMVERLEGVADQVSAEWEPHVITLSRIQHLETRIRARLREGCSVLDALSALHPTPAVCGLPRDAALDFIHENELFDRGWYAGPVGWFDVEGDGVFAPALRCAVRHGAVWRLFAGAGIVAGSEPDLEWNETGIKLEPVLRALLTASA